MSFEKRTHLTFKSQGQLIHAMLHIPSIAHEATVVICHGLGGNRIGANRVFVTQAQSLSKEGIACLRFDFRGNGESDGNIEEMTLDGLICDAHSVLEQLSGPVGILGVSLGGMVTLLCEEQKKYAKSLAFWAPVAISEPWKSEVPQTPLIEYHGRLLSRQFLMQFFEASLDSALEKIADIPFFHAQGEKDTVVTKEHKDYFEAKRRGSVGKSHFLSLPHLDHVFSHVGDRMRLIEETTQWFKETLL